MFDNSYEKICISKGFVDIVTPGGHCGLSTLNIKHNMLHQSKLGGDVELQYTHIVQLKALRGLMQVSMLQAQLGLGLEPVDWYRSKTLFP